MVDTVLDMMCKEAINTKDPKLALSCLLLLRAQVESATERIQMIKEAFDEAGP